jgi:NADP-dependent aldehyde dehydrogenase
MKVTGEMLIGARAVRGTESTLRAVNPATGAELEPPFGGGSAADVDAACALAEAAFGPFRAVSLEKRAAFLETIAQGILDLGDFLLERVISESGLPRGRVEGERARTMAQLRLFASLAQRHA